MLARSPPLFAPSLVITPYSSLVMFGNLPGHEKQAFFSLLDEYFTARPHLLSGQDGEAGSSTAAATPPAPLPRRGNPPPPTARKPVQTSGSNSGISLPAGLSSGKVRLSHRFGGRVQWDAKCSLPSL